jgi:hypothetical protein
LPALDSGAQPIMLVKAATTPCKHATQSSRFAAIARFARTAATG